jgi:outer membrane protein
MEQSKRQLEQARTVLDTADQDLIVRVSQAYFDVLGAQDTLTFVRAQKTAVAEQLASAKRNFEVGTATITDTREAQARFDLVVAQEIAAENDLRVKKLAIDQLVGKTGSQPKPLATLVLPEVKPADPQAWVDQGLRQHPTVLKAKLQVDVAKLDTAIAEAGHKPTLDLTASSYVNRQTSGSDLNATDSTLTRQNIGLTFSLPLFAGFATTNKIKETLALEDKARSDLEAAQRTVEQATRTAYFGVLSSMGQVKAFEAAEASSQVALDANKLGYQVGVRINIDVLNSQSQLYQTKRDLAKARYDVLLGSLKLRQANGTLKSDDLQSVNALLAP